jgi:CheY-like chemotaxis protein
MTSHAHFLLKPLTMQDLDSDHSHTGENPKNCACCGTTGGAANAKCGRVLVMDDEVPILELTARLLTSRGYDVETALDGGTAVQQYRAALEAGRRFDAVILDLTVPEKMGGFEAFEAIKALDPSVKAIVSSGYSHEPVVLNYKDYGIAGVAPKPYRVSELLKAVETVLAV